MNREHNLQIGEQVLMNCGFRGTINWRFLSLHECDHGIAIVHSTNPLQVELPDGFIMDLDSLQDISVFTKGLSLMDNAQHPSLTQVKKMDGDTIKFEISSDYATKIEGEWNE